MDRKSSIMSLFLSVLLVFQFFIPSINGYASAIVSAPSNLKVSVLNTNDIRLNWDTVAGAERYRVYRLDGQSKELYTVTGKTTWDKLRADEGFYTFAVSVMKNGYESELSLPVDVEIIFPDIPAPSEVSYSLSNINNITLNWSSVQEANFYRLYEIIDGQKNFIGITYKTSKEFLNATEGEHTYEIASVSDRFGESIKNKQINISIVYPEIKAPEGLASTIYDGNNLKLSWLPVENATSYLIYQINNNDKQLISTTRDLYENLTNLNEGEFVYEVSAKSASYGESKRNNQIIVSVAYPKIMAPEGLTALVENGNEVYLNWQRAEYASGYDIYEIVNGERIFHSSTTGTNKRFTDVSEGEHIYEVTTLSERFGKSDEAAISSVTVEYPDLTSPEVQFRIKDNKEVILSWLNVKYASSYNVYQVINNEIVLLSNVATTTFKVDELLEGRYEFVVTAKNDYFGESLQSNKVSAEIKPVLDAPSVEEPVVNKDSIILNWSSVPGADSYNIYEVVDGELTLIGNTKDTYYIIENPTPGDHVFQIVPVSSAGVEGEKGSTVLVEVEQSDTTPPQTVANETEEWQHGVYKVELTATDDQSGVAKTFYSVNGSEFVEGTTFTVSEENINNVSFYSVDNAGNVEDVKTIKVNIDNKAPETGSDITDQWINGEVTVKLTATDDQSGVAKTYYSINGSEYVEGTTFTVSAEGKINVSFYSVDKVGNKEEPKTAEVKIDNTAPETGSDVTGKWNKGKVSVTLSPTDNLSGVEKTHYSINGSEYIEGTTFTLDEEGTTNVTFYSVDNAGNVEQVKTVEVKIDITAPETVSDVTDSWNKGGVTVNLTATDNLSGVAKTYYSLNGTDFVEGNTLTITEDGVTKVYYYSVDVAGNVEEVKSSQVKIDKAPPETVSDVTDNWNKGEVTVKLTATDNQSGVAKTFYSVNGSEYTEGTEFTVNKEGINKLSFYSVDNVGNVEEVKTVEVIIDKTAPKTVSDNTGKWHQDQVTVNLVAKDELSDVAKTYYSINGSEFVEGIQFTVSKEGINKVSFYSVDNAGNKEELQTTEIKIDKTAPVVSWDLANQFALGDSLPLAYKASDEQSGIVKETITVNGQTYENTNSVKLDKPGTYQVVVTVTDHAGWTTTLEKTIEVYIPATLIVNPGVIKANAGDFTVKISLPKGYNTNQIDLSTATLNGVSAKSGTNGLVQQAKNGQFKFNRDDFEWKKGMVTVEFRVLVNGILVIGSTTVEVK
jgi:large repetitive protein